MNRAQFLRMSTVTVACAVFSGPSKLLGESTSNDLFFDISLAEWSFHRALFGGKLKHLDFPQQAVECGVHAVEYVNQFFKDKAKDTSYLNELNKRCDDLGVDQVLIMIDGEGSLAVTNDKERLQAVENHHKWVEAASRLGCHAIRVNARGSGSPKEQRLAAVDSLGRLAEFADDFDIEVIVENHGGLSSNGAWLAGVMRQVGRDNCGTLPDFGNFCIDGNPHDCSEAYDRYKGVRQMMPFAKGVSAKSYAFNDKGQETTIDYKRMLQIVKAAGYRGHIGIEYEGDGLTEKEGVLATKKLLEQTGRSL